MLSPVFKSSVYAKRRDEVLSNFEPDRDLLVLFTGPELVRSFDGYYPFRPDSSVLYLTGFAEPQFACLLWRQRSGKATTTHFEIFVMPRDPVMEQWNGYRYGVDRAQKLLGATAAFENSHFETRLNQCLQSITPKGCAPRIFTNAGIFHEIADRLARAVQAYSPPHRSGKLPVAAVGDLRPYVNAQRLIKDKGELDLMHKAGAISVLGHRKIMESLKPGMFEFQAQAVCESEFLSHGARSVAYGSICAGGANATILHYHNNDQRLKAGDLFLVDAGCELDFYASDITRTMPVSGRFTQEQKAIMDVVWDAHEAVIEMVRPGIPYANLHAKAEEVLVEGLLKLKIMKGKKADIIKALSHKKYYPHGTGHWLGLDTHDSCPYLDSQGQSLALKPGMVFTVEPGLYFLPDDKTVDAKWRGIGVRIEDDVAVTAKGCELLTQNLPGSADEIEKFMGRKKKLSPLKASKEAQA
jgi:Xaa-Pro aminopeptidase